MSIIDKSVCGAVEKYQTRVRKVNSLLCVGLDSDFGKLPARFKKETYPQFAFNQWIIDQTHKLVSAYKPNLAFYEARGAAGWQELAMTMDYLNKNYPNIFTIADAKRADIGNTSVQYARAIFDQLKFDAITLHPYLGQEALEPFLTRKDKACIILCKTSNPGAGEIQDLMLNGQPLWLTLAQKVVKDWNQNQNCMLVVGATYPGDLAKVRKLVGEMVLLIPGTGVQGGDLQAVLKAGLSTKADNLIINSSRGVIFAENPAKSAEELRDLINKEKLMLQ